MKRTAILPVLTALIHAAAAHGGATGAEEAAHTSRTGLASIGVPLWQIGVFMAAAVLVGAVLGRWVYNGQVSGR